MKIPLYRNDQHGADVGFSNQKPTTSVVGGFTEAQQQRVREAKSPEELLEIAKEEGFELSDSDLEAVSGGWDECDTYTGNKHDRFCRHYR